MRGGRHERSSATRKLLANCLYAQISSGSCNCSFCLEKVALEEFVVCWSCHSKSGQSTSKTVISAQCHQTSHHTCAQHLALPWKEYLLQDAGHTAICAAYTVTNPKQGAQANTHSASKSAHLNHAHTVCPFCIAGSTTTPAATRVSMLTLYLAKKAVVPAAAAWTSQSSDITSAIRGGTASATEHRC